MKIASIDSSSSASFVYCNCLFLMNHYYILTTINLTYLTFNLLDVIAGGRRCPNANHKINEDYHEYENEAEDFHFKTIVDVKVFLEGFFSTYTFEVIMVNWSFTSITDSASGNKAYSVLVEEKSDLEYLEDLKKENNSGKPTCTNICKFFFLLLLFALPPIQNKFWTSIKEITILDFSYVQ